MQTEELTKSFNLADSSVVDTLYQTTSMRNDDDPDTPRAWNCIGDLYWERYRAVNHVVDLDKAISSYSQSVKLTPELDPERLAHIGVVFSARFERTGRVADIDAACFCFERSLLIDATSAHARARMMNFGTTLLERFERRGDLNDVDRAVTVLQQAVEIAPLDDPSLSSYLSNLGNALQLRFKRLGDVSDLDASIHAKRKAVDLTLEGHLDKPGRLNNLGVGLRSRFERLGSLSDIEASIDAFRKAVELTPEEHLDKPSWLNSLGVILQTRFDRLGNLSDLDASIDAKQKATDLTPEGHPDQPIWLNNLVNGLRSRFERLGNVADLEASIAVQRKAVTLTPDGHAFKLSWLNNLGVVLQARFERLGNVSDLDASIDAKRKVVELTPMGHPDKPGRLNNIGNALQLRFQRLGNLSDIEASIDAHRKAVDLTPEGHPMKPRRLNNLGSGLRSRFARLGSILDLEASVDSLRKVVELTPEGHPDKPGRLNNLSIILQSRFERLGSVCDLDASIDAKRKAIKLTPEGHPHEHIWLNGLGNSLRLRFERLGHVADLEASIDVQRKAVTLTPDGHAFKPSLLTNLGNALYSRFKHVGDVADLEVSIDTLRKAVDLTANEHTDRPNLLNSLSNALRLRFVRLGNASDLRETLEVLSSSAQSVFGAPSVKLDAAQAWGSLSEVINDEEQAIHAYGCAVSLIPRAAWVGLAIEGRHQVLAKIGDFVTKAAVAAVRYGQPNLALEWLEQGRSIVWGQTLELRSPLDVLRECDPGRARRLTEISRALDTNSKDSISSGEETGRQLRTLALEWDQLLCEVRRMNGFEDFLGPKKVEQLLPAASLSPIVVLNSHKAGCDALVLMSQEDKVIHIPLLFTSDRAQILLDSLQTARVGRSMARHSDSVDRHIQVKGGVKLDPDERIKSLLAELWNMVVKPVLDGLAFALPKTGSEDDDLPRICWCPTGPLGFLPIHAAGLYDTEERGTKVFDFVVSSYTPTVTALLRPPIDNTIPPKILAIAQAEYRGRSFSSLPQTKQEIALIGKQAAKNSVDFVAAEDAAGTVKYVLEEMAKYNWIHLACHGIQDVENPTKSAFILADGNLELEEIVKLTLPHAEFAFLSACQTAAGDAKLAEEAVHLAAGMLLAGYRSVIATMWSIRDQDGPIVADAVYSELLKDGKADASRAAYALHKAVQQLRSSGASFLSWIPFIHMGR